MSEPPEERSHRTGEEQATTNTCLITTLVGIFLIGLFFVLLVIALFLGLVAFI